MSGHGACILFRVDIDKLRPELGIKDLLAAVEPEVAREHIGDAARECKVHELPRAEELDAQHDRRDRAVDRAAEHAHESERRGETFVTRKITLAAARIAQGKQDKLYLGNLSSLRDWGYAKDYVECMWLILQNDKPEDFVIATGEQHSVREFCQLAFHDVGIELEFVGEGMNEKGIDKATGKTVIEVSPDFYRPTDVVNLWGDPSKAKRELGWNPTKTTFEELVKIMVDHDMKKVAVERAEEHIKTNLAEYLEKGVIK